MEDIITVIGLSLLVFGLAYALFNKVAINRPSAVALIVLGISTALYYNTGFYYKDEVTASTWEKILIYGIVMALFAFIGENISKRENRIKTVNANVLKGSINTYICRKSAYFFLLVGSICVTALILNNGPVLMNNGLDALRIGVYSGEIGQSILGRIGRFAGFLYFSLGIVNMNSYAFSKTEKRNIVLAIAIQCLVMSTLTGGRWPLIAFCIIMVMTIRVKLDIFKQNIKIILSVITIVVIYAVSLPLLRFSVKDPVMGNKVAFDLEYTMKTEELLYSIPPAFCSAYLSVTTYLTQGPAYLQSYISNEEPPSGGLLLFPWLYRVVGIQPWSAYEKAQEVIRSQLAGEARFTEIWATSLRELLFDFGYFGAGIICALWGIIIGYVYNRVESNGNISLILLYVGMIPMLAFFPIASPYANPFMMFMLNNAIILYVPSLIFTYMAKTQVYTKNMLLH